MDEKDKVEIFRRGYFNPPAQVYGAQAFINDDLYDMKLLPRCNALHPETHLQCIKTWGHDEEVHMVRHDGSLVKWETVEDSSTEPILTRDTPFEGWRGWRVSVSSRTAFLQSTAAPVSWAGPTQQVDCKRIWSGQGINDSPRELWPYLGIHAYKSLEYLVSYSHPMIPISVIGRVDLTGHVVEHILGYRAQKCIIRELWVLDGHVSPDHIPALEDRYQCDVHLVPSILEINHE